MLFQSFTYFCLIHVISTFVFSFHLSLFVFICHYLSLFVSIFLCLSRFVFVCLSLYLFVFVYSFFYLPSFASTCPPKLLLLVSRRTIFLIKQFALRLLLFTSRTVLITRIPTFAFLVAGTSYVSCSYAFSSSFVVSLASSLTVRSTFYTTPLLWPRTPLPSFSASS